jgi:hypothetical protein
MKIASQSILNNVVSPVITDAKGGDLVLRAGAGLSKYKQANGSIKFQLGDGTDYLVIDGDGNAFVRGELVGNNKAVFEAFSEWVGMCSAYEVMNS